MMNFSRIVAVASKEWREIVRDRLFFALAFVVPTVLILLFGYGLSLDVENIPMAVVDHDRSPLSRELAHRFMDSRYFAFKGYADDERQLTDQITQGKLRAVIVIPPHFQRDLQAGQPAQVQTLIDGTFPFRALTTKSYARAISSAMAVDVLADYLAHQTGIPVAQARATMQPIGLQVRYLYNQSVKSMWSLGPKLIMVIMMISPPFLTALGVVREKESGSIFNIYASTVRRSEFLIGKLAPYVAISWFNCGLQWLVATQLFGAPFKGDFLFFVLTSMLYVTCTTGIGLLVSVLVRTQVAAILGTAVLMMVPAVLYSGVLVPIPSLSAVATVIAHLLPGMYYAEIVEGVFLKNVAWAELWPNVLILAGYAVALFGVGYTLFRKRVAS